LTRPPSSHAGGCQCLMDDVPAALEIPHRSPPLTCGGHDMNTSQPLEPLTVLTTTTQGPCGCGCGCDEGFSLTQLMPPQPSNECARAEHEDASGNGG
jgi:hypothetical protein